MNSWCRTVIQAGLIVRLVAARQPILFTSRSRLSGLVARDGAHRLDLDILSLPEAIDPNRFGSISINPKMLSRLNELEKDLLARRERAVAEDWRGEIDGLDLTFLRSKREQARRFARSCLVSLGLPAVPHQKPQVTRR